MMRNVSGQEIDYESFKAEFDANPQLKNLVDRFDGKGIVIKTKEKNMPSQSGQPPKTDNAAIQRAANNILQQPG
jgi:hypothetical protein